MFQVTSKYLYNTQASKNNYWSQQQNKEIKLCYNSALKTVAAAESITILKQPNFAGQGPIIHNEKKQYMVSIFKPTCTMSRAKIITARKIHGRKEPKAAFRW